MFYTKSNILSHPGALSMVGSGISGVILSWSDSSMSPPAVGHPCGESLLSSVVGVGAGSAGPGFVSGLVSWVESGRL